MSGKPSALERLLDEIHEEFPRFRIVPKAKSPLSKIIDVGLKIVTLGMHATSAAYGWMWPFRRSVERWYDEALRELERP